MFDQKCYDLAAEFLSDGEPDDMNTEANRKTLAQCIQDSIEAEIEDMREKTRRLGTTDD